MRPTPRIATKNAAASYVVRRRLGYPPCAELRRRGELAYGKPAAVLVPIDEYEALEETAEILSDARTLAAIEAGVADLARDDTVTLTELRSELAERRAVR